MENISSGQTPRTADPSLGLLLFCWSRYILCAERKRCEVKEMGDTCSWWFLMVEQKEFRKSRPMVWAFVVFWEVQSFGILGIPLSEDSCRAEEPCLPRGQWQCVQAGPHKDQCWVSKHCLPQGMCWAGVSCRPTSIHPLGILWAASRSCDPDEFTRQLSRVCSSPASASYTFAHPNPVLCTMMQTLIINQIIQPAFSNSCLIQSFLLSLLFDVCFHILFIAYNLSAAVNTELLIAMDFCYTYHYSVWILFNHHNCIFRVLQRFSSHFTD